MVADYDQRHLTREKKDKVLKEFGYTCAYCCDDATEVDHIIPFCYSHDDSEANLAASCHFCNAVANDKLFKDFAAKREYLVERKYRYFAKRPVPVWLKTELDDLGYALRTKILPGVAVVDDEDMASRVIHSLSELGYTAYRRIIRGVRV